MKGTYLLILFIRCNSNIKIGSLGNINFESGYYIYVGSAMGNKGSSTLMNRVKRHIKDSELKKIHWHIDYLLKNNNVCLRKIYLIPSKTKLECLIAKDLNKSSECYILNFGSSDCKCKSHLFYCRKSIIKSDNFLRQIFLKNNKNN
ncbi:MAG: GIY-YIG nuclease family protein [Candidatus Lokiarchaeota archaeon]|nr:GIY-YIG nuclease family protein [Candidatus Lokiarchaeota archaeon]